jgi:hypothetical protein
MVASNSAVSTVALNELALTFSSIARLVSSWKFVRGR